MLYEQLGGEDWDADFAQNWRTGDPCMDTWARLNCSENGRVVGLWLQNAGMRGALPPELSNMDALDRIDLQDNNLEYPSSAAARAAYDQATVRCITPQTKCLGLPPHSCTAFGEKYILSISDPAACDRCPDSLLLPALTFAGLALVVMMITGVYVLVVVKYPEALKHWVSTMTIGINHAQTYGIIGSLGLEWPSSVKYLIAVLRFDFRVPNAACVLQGSDDNSPFWMYSTGFLGLFVFCLSTMVGLRSWFECSGRKRSADVIEFVLSIVFAMQLTTAWRMIALVSTQPGAWMDTDTTLPLISLLFGACLVVIDVVLVVHFWGNVKAYCRGTGGGDWYKTHHSCGVALPCLRGEKHNKKVQITPRRLEFQVRYLVIRFASHAPRWQFVVWLRQVLLFCVVNVIEFGPLVGLTESTLTGWLKWAMVGAAMFIVLCFWAWHHRTQPYVYRYQNTFEVWLYAATLLVLGLACVYDRLPNPEWEDPDNENPDSAGHKITRLTLECVMFATIVLSLLGSGVYMYLEYRDMRAALREFNPVELLEKADAKIDGVLRSRLADGTIRLLKLSWLTSVHADPALAKHTGTGAPVVRRRQDLPDQAFFPPEAAANLLDKADRSVLVLSYRWSLIAHPDPMGETLAMVRRYAKSLPTHEMIVCGLFWDFCSVPQRGANGEERSPAEQKQFEEALSVMGSCFASMTGTAVLQVRTKVLGGHLSEFEGRIMVHDVGEGEKDESPMQHVTRETAFKKTLEAELALPDDVTEGDGRMLTTAVAKFCMQCGAEYGGDEVTVCEKCGNERPAVEAPDVGVPNSTADAVLKDVILIGGLADVTFASLDMAQRCASKLRRQGRDARMASEYTTIHYDRETAADSGKPFSGWCTFEQGVAMLVNAHVMLAQKQAEDKAKKLPARFARAARGRSKLTDISSATPVPREIDESPAALLKATTDAIDKAHFTMEADRVRVRQMFAELEWTMKTAVEDGLKDHADSGLTIDPKAWKRASKDVETAEEIAEKENRRKQVSRALERQAWIDMETLNEEDAAKADALGLTQADVFARSKMYGISATLWLRHNGGDEALAAKIANAPKKETLEEIQKKEDKYQDGRGEVTRSAAGRKVDAEDASDRSSSSKEDKGGVGAAPSGTAINDAAKARLAEYRRKRGLSPGSSNREKRESFDKHKAEASGAALPTLPHDQLRLPDSSKPDAQVTGTSSSSGPRDSPKLDAANRNRTKTFNLTAEQQQAAEALLFKGDHALPPPTTAEAMAAAIGGAGAAPVEPSPQVTPRGGSLMDSILSGLNIADKSAAAAAAVKVQAARRGSVARTKSRAAPSEEPVFATLSRRPSCAAAAPAVAPASGTPRSGLMESILSGLGIVDKSAAAAAAVKVQAARRGSVARSRANSTTIPDPRTQEKSSIELAPAPAPVALGKPPVAQPAGLAEGPSKFCMRCGGKFTSGSAACGQCGNARPRPSSTAAAPAPAAPNAAKRDQAKHAALVGSASTEVATPLELPIGSAVYCKRSNGQETLAYVVAYAEKNDVYKVELGRGSGSYKMVTKNMLRKPPPEELNC